MKRKFFQDKGLNESEINFKIFGSNLNPGANLTPDVSTQNLDEVMHPEK